jgi:hypothetical protein
MTPHYKFAETFRELYDRALDLYSRGQRSPHTFFSAEENAWLAANGLTPQHIYDYAEDHATFSEPGYDIALGIEYVRRDYFLNVQDGHPSAIVLDESTLPAKTATVNGLEWLPRIIPKARAKLRGELPPSLMYCCGGDRRFFQTHDIHPVEFLSFLWRHEHDTARVIDWVTRRSAYR